jgi:excisionase family DNA binding protein
VEPLAVDVREAGRLTSLSPRTIRRFIKLGRLRAVRVGRRIVVPLASLNDLLKHPSDDGATEESNAPSAA